ncbi:MAG: type II toxin-antitoxin system VapC family toxin [Planctomycetes bacterium]|nr:type II toxin-antitoxin system VapC family toxin [Planctomycetota bacterium]
MNGSLLAQVVLIDTSAAVALEDPGDQFHKDAKAFFTSAADVVWASVNVTAHEAFTRARHRLGYEPAICLYDFLTGEEVYRIPFASQDEVQARRQLERFREHRLSFHDALIAAVMKRVGIYRTFAFDRHFWLFGFEVLPGRTR